ncbi:MAG: hypothetical protein ABFR36_08650 [Acidobacteriota bacterium]
MAVKKKAANKESCNWIFNLIVKFIDTMRNVLSEKLFEFLKKWLLILGNCGFYIASILALLIGIIGAIRMESFEAFITGLAYALGFFILQYVAVRFASAGDKLIENNKTGLSSAAFLDSMGLLFMIGGALALLFNSYLAIKLGSFSPFLNGLGTFIVLELFALLALNPKTITLDVVPETSAGQEAIGIVTFFLKSFMKLVPIMFGVGIVVTTVLMFIHSFGLFKKGMGMSFAWTRVLGDFQMIAAVALLPLIAFILFVFVFLAIDVVRSILSIPSKLDKLAKK